MNNMHHCVYGGQYGSEGKGAVSEFLITQTLGSRPRRKWTVIGENGPNSGHTCSAGSVRSLPAASFFADRVILGPEAVVDLDILKHDILNIQAWRANQNEYDLPQLQGGRLEVYIHENAALMTKAHSAAEKELPSVMAISSTGSGSGLARYDKFFFRMPSAVVSCLNHKAFAPYDIRVITRQAWPILVTQALMDDCLFECSQGFMLDTSLGLYPHVTSRPTSPRVAVERNGFGLGSWHFNAVIRTFPIRTGGPSGPTGGRETSFEEIGVKSEIATVTKRTRRIFEFSIDDFVYMMWMTRPHSIYITHADYVAAKVSSDNPANLDMHRIMEDWWYDNITSQSHQAHIDFHDSVWYSSIPSVFQKL